MDGETSCVYLMWHWRKPQDNGDAKLIGVYRTEDDARGAINRLRDQPGCRHFPDDFLIEKYELNKDHWTEGFVTSIVLPDGSMSFENE
jgi:hypothetical protein